MDLSSRLMLSVDSEHAVSASTRPNRHFEQRQLPFANCALPPRARGLGGSLFRAPVAEFVKSAATVTRSAILLPFRQVLSAFNVAQRNAGQRVRSSKRNGHEIVIGKGHPGLPTF